MNTFEKLMALDQEKLDQESVAVIEIKRLSKILGEKFEVKCKGIGGDRYAEASGSAAGKNGEIDYGKAHHANCMVNLAGMVEPDLKNHELQLHFGTHTPLELMNKLFNGGEIATIAQKITELSGFGEDVEEEVKN